MSDRIIDPIPDESAGNADVRAGAALLVAAIVLITGLTFRNAGLTVVVLSDEWLYSLWARLQPHAEAARPSYLFYTVFRGTSACGSGFLECARLFNAVFLALSLPFIYRVARTCLPPRAALLIAALAVFGPASSYATYFMPETMYFLGFWTLAWLVLTHDRLGPVRLGVGAGVVLGLMALIKAHAVFLLPAVLLHLALSPCAGNPDVRAKDRFVAIATAVAAFLVVRFLLGWGLAGPAGLALMGHEYAAIAGARTGWTRMATLLRDSAGVLLGHALGLAIMFGVPLAAIADRLLARGASAGVPRIPAIHRFAVLVVGSLLPVVALFTAQVAGEGPYETTRRLHMRYYDFALPLLYVVAASEFEAGRVLRSSNVVRTVLALGIAALAVAGLLMVPSAYVPSLVDSPGLRGIGFDSRLFVLLGALGLACLGWWWLHPRRGAMLYVYVLLPASVVVAGYFLYTEVRSDYARKNVYDLAGTYVNSFLPRRAASTLLVLGSDHSGVLRALFHVDDAGARSRALHPNAPFELSSLPSDRRWLLIVGEHAVVPEVAPYVSLPGFTLYRVGPIEIDFSDGDTAGTIHSVRGLSGVEDFGRWSDGDEVLLEFSQPFPRRFELVLAGNAFGPNAGQAFEIRVGSESRFVTFASVPSTASSTFATDGNERKLRIRVPQPVSPKSLGLGGDDRRLGVGLRRLTIRELPDA